MIIIVVTVLAFNFLNMKYFLFLILFSFVLETSYCQTKDSLQIIYYKAKRYLYNNNINEAERLSEYLIRVDTSNSKFYYLYAGVCVSKKSFEKARSNIKKAYSLNKDSFIYFSNLEYLYSQSHEYDSAKYYINKLIRNRPDSVLLYKDRSFYNLMLNDTVNYKLDIQHAAKLGDKGAAKTLRIIEGKEEL